MQLLTKAILKQFEKTGNQDGKGKNAKVIVKYFLPFGQFTWLATEYDKLTKTFFGYVIGSFGKGEAEFGYFSLEQLEKIRTPDFGLPIERDLCSDSETTIQQHLDVM